MSLDSFAFRTAEEVFAAEPTRKPGAPLRAAIEYYISAAGLLDHEVFTTGELVVGEPITPPRDYRKELWIAVAAATAGASNCTKVTSPALFADTTLAAFDKAFGEQK